MNKTYASVLSEGVIESGWNQHTQITLCLDFISSYLEKKGLLDFQSFLYNTADKELFSDDNPDSFNPLLQIELCIQNANVLNGIESSSGKYLFPEEILDSISDITGWNESTKLQLVCRFLEKYYSDRIDFFESNIQQIIVDETSGSFI